MELKIIEYDEYIKFALASDYISIYQLPEWGELKKVNGWDSYLLGLYDNKKLKGVTLLLEKKLPLNISLFYAPRGYLLDMANYDLLSTFTKEIKKFIRKKHGFMLKVDPNAILNLYDQNGEFKEEVGKDILDNFKRLGYKHLGFTKNFETMQPRYLCRFNILDDYNSTLETLSKTTRKNIAKTLRMGVRVREIGIDEIDLFVSILACAGQEKEFIIRPVSYYKKMYELMSDYIKLYITYIDTEEYYKYVTSEIESTKKELINIEKFQNKGKKLLDAKAKYEEKLVTLDNDLKEAIEMRKNESKINIGALMSIFIKDEGITFMSGTVSLYKKFNPKYAYYNHHIEECVKQKKKYCNFYGISGDLDKNSKYYNIYEIKKGFNPEVVELVGEFDLINNHFIYFGYKVALWMYKLIKRIKK